MAKNEALKKVIEEIKLSQNILQSDIAKIIGVKNTYLSDVINGRVPLSDNLAEKFSEQFHIDKVRLLGGEGEMFKDNRTVAIPFDAAACHIPLLPISAQGGSLNDFVISVKNNDCERVLSPIKGADFAMTVAGDSMAPEYPAGSQILIKKINEQLFIEWGKVFVIDTANGVVVKIVTQSDNADCIRCSSINPDQRRYAPFDIPSCEIYGMYRVLLCMSLK